MRYYSTQRPIGLGTFPAGLEVRGIVNFDQRTYCKEIGREAWGYVDILRTLSDDEARSWGLTPEEVGAWYPVTVSSQKHGGGLKVSSGPAIVRVQRPGDIRGETKHSQYKTRFFKTWGETLRVMDVLQSIDITTERVRPSATQGECKVFINGQYILSFGDNIVLLKRGASNENYYGDNIGGYRSDMPDSSFTLGLIWHKFDSTYHYSDRVCRALGITPEQWI